MTLKKRLIFTLLFDDGFFVLSRNFRLQRVGDLTWLQKNYDICLTSRSIDELIVLNVSRQKSSLILFSEALKDLTKGCFVPVSAGGGIRSINDVELLLKSGADKVVLNTSIATDPSLVNMIGNRYGNQCIVASIDVKKETGGQYAHYVNSGQTRLSENPKSFLERTIDDSYGEIYLNSIDRDGTGKGYDMDVLDLLPTQLTKPVILAGGVGNSRHFETGLRDDRVNAVATAQLHNFIGDGMKMARKNLIVSGFAFPIW
jgi:cyclase